MNTNKINFRSLPFVSIRVYSWITVLTLSSLALGQTVNRPLLEELNRQTQSLYNQVAQSVVRVQLPTAPPSTQPVDVLERWASKLTPALRDRLAQEAALGATFVAEIAPSTQEGVLSPRPPTLIIRSTISPNVLGFIVDDQGHAMLPAFTSAAIVGDRPIPVVLSDGSVVAAKFVASDQMTNITVIQVMRDGLQPLPLSVSPPQEGTLVLAMSLDPNATRLAVWTRWSNSFGLVVRIDGAVAGFSGRGQYLSAAAYAPVVRQLIDHGHVERALLGVRIKVVPPNDPQRLTDTRLGQTPALRITQVIPGSPADRQGLHVGDLILALANEPVEDAESFALAISTISQQPGPTDLRIFKNGQISTVAVDLHPGDASH
jgi:S1-C subfamily serine protease